MSPNENNQVSPGDLVASIFKSPISLESTKILVKIFINEKQIIERNASKIDIKQFLFRLLKTGEIDSFMNHFQSNRFKHNVEIQELLKHFGNRKNDHDLILKYMNPENFIIKMELSEFLLNFSKLNFNQDLIYFYIDFDPEFVKKFINQLNLHILRIIKEFKGLTYENDKFVYLFSALIFIIYIPYEKSRFLPQADYEPLLDFTIELFKLKKISAKIPFLFIGNVLSFPYVKITQSGLNKYFEILKNHYDGDEENNSFICTAFGTILAKLFDFEDAFEIFKMVVHFSESKKIDCVYFVPLMLVFRGKIFCKIFDFSVQHHLLSKTEISLIQKNLETLCATVSKI